MGSDDTEAKDKQNRNTITIVLFLVGYIGVFIPTIIWWSRIHPWFSHGEKDGKAVYQCLFACWILSLAGIALSAFLLISNLFLELVCSRIVDRFYLLVIIFILESAFSIGSIISGSYAVSYALKNPKSNEDSNNKCLKYISYGISGASTWAYKNNKIKDFGDWFTKLGKKVLKDNGSYNGYICRDVGASTLTFVIVLCIAFVFLIGQLCKTICLAGIYG